MVKTKGSLQVQSENIFPIIRDSLYKDRDAFVRELISNAADAIQKRRVVEGEPNASGAGAPWTIRLAIDQEKRTLCVTDNGVGMTAEEIDCYINQMAFSGAVDFLRRYAQGEQRNIIGHFGLGFYSAFMVASFVTIDSLSCRRGAAPVRWECSGENMRFAMGKGERTRPGTDITLHLDELSFLNPAALKKAVQKYCQFIPFEIVLDVAGGQTPELMNETCPLWAKPPETLTDEAYLSFYHEQFQDYNDPVFWLNLYDEEMGVKGVLYFRHIEEDAASIGGTVKLYSNRVFVGDNLRELIPDYLLLQNGMLEVEDLPLNVSRASLRDDETAAAVRRYLSEQVGKKVRALFETDYRRYSELWPKISPALKIGLLQDKTLKNLVKDCVLYETTAGERLTLPQLLERNPGHPGQVFYLTDEVQQLGYIRLLEAAGITVAKLPHVVDQPFIQLMELEGEGLRYRRIDADILEILREPGQDGAREETLRAVKTAFAGIIDERTTTLAAEKLKAVNVPMLILTDEKLRRTKEAMELYSLHRQSRLMQAGHPMETCVANTGNPLVRQLLQNPGSELTSLLARQLYDLARLGQESMTAESTADFIEQSHRLMERLTQAESPRFQEGR